MTDRYTKRITVVIDASFGADEDGKDRNAYTWSSAKDRNARNILASIAAGVWPPGVHTVNVELSNGDCVEGNLVSIAVTDPADPAEPARPALEIWDDPGGEWAALYVNGKLSTYGDRENPVDRALQLAGVTLVQDDAFLLGGDGADGVAKTLAEIDDFRYRRDQRRRVAQQKRQEAARLLAQAAEIEAGDGWT